MSAMVMGSAQMASHRQSHIVREREKRENLRGVRISIYILREDTSVSTLFHISTNSQFQGIFRIFSSSQGNVDNGCCGQYSFFYGERNIHYDQSPNDIGLCDGDCVTAVLRGWSDMV